MKRVVTIGGGKGQGTILQGLNKFPDQLILSAIISTFDNGGSTGRLREELGTPSFGGDFRDVMTALCNDQNLIELFQHRYEFGTEIKGHSVGNLILLGLLEMNHWDIPAAIADAKRILNIQADILPSTVDKVDLVAQFSNGQVIKGQTQIDDDMEREYVKIEKISTEPMAQAYPGAVTALEQADAIILCPGDLYGSLLCNLVVNGIREAVAHSQAKIIYIVNLMTKVNQTDGWVASNFLDEVQKYLPRKIDYAIVNSDVLPEDISGKEQYKEEHWEMVANDLQEEKYKGMQLIKQPIWHEGKEFRRISTDVIPRSFIRHDSDKIAQIILELLG